MIDGGPAQNRPTELAEAEQPILLTDEHSEAEVREFEDGMSILPVFTICMSAILTAVFIWEIATGALSDNSSIVAAGALSRSDVIAGEYWRLLSAAFLHGSTDHLIGNCLAFYVIGMALEHAVGIRKTALIYFVTAIAGSLLSMALQPGPSVGASGAIFGLLGAITAFLYRNRKSIGMRDRRIYGALGVWAIYQIILGAMNPMIDNGAHVGGLMMGLGLGWYARPRPT